MRPRVVYVDPQVILMQPEPRRILAEAGAQLVEIQCETEADVMAATRDADAVIDVRAPITRNVIQNFTRCKLVVRCGIGIDTVDIPAATEHRVMVANVPDFCWHEVADTAMSHILATTRKLIVAHEAMRAGRWERETLRPLKSLNLCTLGILGFGNIGRQVARRAAPFGFRIIAHDPYVSDEKIRQHGAEPCSFDHLLANSDVLTIHCPLTSETRGLIDEKALKRMKNTAFLVNTSRGPVVDQRALYRALSEGWIAGAGLDVFEKEPIDPNDPLLKLPNVVLTPHYASFTDEAMLRLMLSVAQQTVQVLRGERPKFWVNPW